MNLKKFVFNPFAENTYVVWDETTGDAVVIDPGMSNTREQQLFDRFITETGLDLRQIVNTHLHLDHCWGNNYIRDRYGATIAASEADAFLSARLAEQAMMFGVDSSDIAPVHIDTAISDDDKICFGNSGLTVLSVPGHSPGSIALYSPSDSLILVGDTLFRGSIGRTDLPGGSYKTIKESIVSRLFPLPDTTTVYPGHEASTTIGYEKEFNPYI